MTATQKRKFLDAIAEIERREGTDTPLSPGSVWGLFLASFPDLWTELKEPFAEACGLQLIAAQHTRSRRSESEQMTLALPGFEPFRIPIAIRVPPVTKKGEPSRKHKGHWGKTLEVPLSDFRLYLDRQERRLKDGSTRRRQKLKALGELFRIAQAGARGNFKMPMKDALATQAAKQEAKSAGYGAGWLFSEVKDEHRRPGQN
jgi:hypothetical protein